MKKQLPFYAILLIFPLIALILISNSNGANPGFTGSPGDAKDCSGCHAGAITNTGFDLTTTITTNIPSGGYALNQIYTMTITQTTNTSAASFGFEITAENSIATQEGFFVATDATNTQSKGFNKYLTHTQTGSHQKSWSFDWTAPATDEGAITFYVATIAGDGNGVSNTQQNLKTYTVDGVLGVNKSKLLNFSMFPNPSDGQVTLQLPSDINQADVRVFDYLGKMLLKKSINSANNTLDVSNLNTGIYFVRIQTDTKIGTKKLILR